MIAGIIIVIAVGMTVVAWFAGFCMGERLYGERLGKELYSEQEIRRSLAKVVPSWFGEHRPYNYPRVIDEVIKKLKDGKSERYSKEVE